MRRVVIDTNVIISAAISRDGTPARVFELVLSKQIINYTTKEILNEISVVMERPRISVTEDMKRFIFSYFKKHSVFVRPNIKIRKLQDTSDNKFLECAICSNAGYIISGDSHLLNLMEYKDIRIVSPKQFLHLF